MQGTPVETLLSDFNKYRFQTANVFKLRQQGKHIVDIKSHSKKGKELCAALGQMIEFCAERHIDPRLWLYSLFKARLWQFAPLPKQLCSKKHIERFQKVGKAQQNDHAGYTQHVTQEIARSQAATTYDARRDLTPAAEVLKQRYVAQGDYQRCIDLMGSQTLGYHPKSRVCVSCPVAQACANKLCATFPFDILALREGRITAEQAQDTMLRMRPYVS
jgi:hypothetical protein